MTEAEWLACADPQPMLAFLLGKVSERRLRLFACACCRRIVSLLPDKVLQQNCLTALEQSEALADNLIPAEKLQEAWASIFGVDAVGRQTKRGGLARTPHRYAVTAVLIASRVRWDGREAEETADNAALAFAYTVRRKAKSTEKFCQTDLLRHIFGNPFRPVAVDSAWRTTTVTSLAQAIYDERAFDRLPILADALEKAGCTNGEILSHCRGPGPHVRGCWVVDLLLGKE